MLARFLDLPTFVVGGGDGYARPGRVPSLLIISGWRKVVYSETAFSALTWLWTQGDGPMSEGEQHEVARLSGGLWCRASSYEVTADILCLIRPARGATLEPYDPWEADRSARLEEDRPYKQLLRLVQQIGMRELRLDPEATAGGP